MRLKINPAGPVRGITTIPGDKSISHRAVILTSLASGRSIINGFLEGEDCLHTIQAFQKLGVKIEKMGPGSYQVDGEGLYALQKPTGVINCGNSGTCMRIMAGLLAAQEFYCVLTGDNSLQNRPMDRIIEPLTMMGARFWARQDKFAPLGIRGGNLRGMDYSLPVASAQVKSALLMAGLFAEGDLYLDEPYPSRDHTERMLKYMGVELEVSGNRICLSSGPSQRLKPCEINIPGDISSAAFFIAAALINPGSEILLKNVGINSSRSGILDVIKKMGGRLELLNKQIAGGEPAADILVKSSKLNGTVIEGEIIPRLIDEIPIIAVIAAQASGETIIRDAEELRVKETDRIKAIISELSKFEIEVRELKDGMVIKGNNTFRGGVQINSYGDHRMVMSMAIAGLIADDNTIINDCDCINTSFPEFIKILKSLLN